VRELTDILAPAGHPHCVTAFRLLSISAHGALEMLLGLVALVAPFGLGFGLAGAVVSILFGVVLVGLALSTTDSGLRLSAHYTLDYGLAVGAAAAAVLVGLAGDRPALLFLIGLAVAQLALNASTRYSAKA